MITRFGCLALCLLVALPMTAFAQEEIPQLDFVAEGSLPTGEMFKGTEFGGISSISYDTERDVYYTISDDRGAHGPIRYYTLTLNADDNITVEIQSVTEIHQSDGKAFEVDGADAEGLTYDSLTDTLLWSSEGDENGIPSLREMTIEGDFIREFSLPEYYLPGDGRGVASNQAFEALTLSVDGQQIITATESALVQDGPLATLEAGSLSRLLVFDYESGDVVGEYVYETGPIPHEATQAPYSQDNGLTELIGISETTLIAMERSFALGVGNTISLSLIDLTDATNITGVEMLADAEYTPVKKTPLLTLNEGDFGLDLDNVEGMTLGLLDEQFVIVFVSDNNFNPDNQPTTNFLVFSLNSES